MIQRQFASSNRIETNLLKQLCVFSSFFNIFLAIKKYQCHLNEVTTKLLNALLFSGAFIKTFATCRKLLHN